MSGSKLMLKVARPSKNTESTIKLSITTILKYKNQLHCCDFVKVIGWVEMGCNMET